MSGMERAAKAIAAARWLHEEHRARRRFVPLPPEHAPADIDEAYLAQDEFVALRAKTLGPVIGYKIALCSAAMQKYVGVDAPQAGAIHETQVRRSPAVVRLADYVRLIVEFEIAVQLADDLPAADAPFTGERVARAVAAVMPALELADDRDADYAKLPEHPLHLIADNTWNEGVVLGKPVEAWASLQLAAVRGVATVNGVPVGEGRGADAMGHPFEAVAWIATHLARSGRGLLRGDVVITGSLVTSQTARHGDVMRFSLEGIGEAELRVE